MLYYHPCRWATTTTDNLTTYATTTNNITTTSTVRGTRTERQKKQQQHQHAQLESGDGRFEYDVPRHAPPLPARVSRANAAASAAGVTRACASGLRICLGRPYADCRRAEQTPRQSYGTVL